MRARDKSKFEKRREQLYAAMRMVGEKFDMARWLVFTGDHKPACINPTMKDFEECGSAACICGIGLLLMPTNLRPRTRPGSLSENPKAVMSYYNLSSDVVGTVCWPEPLEKKYHNAKTYKGRIAAAIQACKHFVID